MDPLEILFVRDAMRTNLVAFPAGSTLEQVRSVMRANHGPRGQHLYPVVDEGNRLRGVITRKHLQLLLEDPSAPRQVWRAW